MKNTFEGTGASGEIEGEAVQELRLETPDEESARLSGVNQSAIQAEQVGEKLSPGDEAKKLIFEFIDEMNDPDLVGYRQIVERGDFFTPGVFEDLSIYDHYKELAQPTPNFDPDIHEKVKKIFSLLEQVRNE